MCAHDGGKGEGGAGRGLGHGRAMCACLLRRPLLVPSIWRPRSGLNLELAYGGAAAGWTLLCLAG